MSLYYCAMTGEPCQDPVASKKTGHIYERRVIEKYIDSTLLDPITNQSLTKDDLISIQTSNIVKPRPVNAGGVSQLLSIFQSEYDALMLESHALKQNLENMRQELSHSLYQHDAACRVISRLVKERDEAVGKLEEIGQNAPGIGMEEEREKGLPQQILDRVTERKGELNAMRKEKKKNKEIIARYASQEMIAEYRVTNSLTLHATKKPGITCLDIHPDQDDLLVTGGNDGAVIFYNKSRDQIVNTYDKHSKKITGVSFLPTRDMGENSNVQCILSSEDGYGQLLSNNIETGQISVAYRIDSHREALAGCAVHPVGDLGVFGARDGSFSYHDLSQGKLVNYATLDGYQIRTLKIHPDGHIIAFGGHDGTIRIWSILEHAQVAEIKAHNGAIDSLNFSENGVNFATGSVHDKTVKLWDLRNLGEENFKLVDANSGGAVNFDQFGQFLAVGTTSLRMFNVKDLEEFVRLDAHKDMITSIQFGNNSKYIATVSLDRKLNIYS